MKCELVSLETGACGVIEMKIIMIIIIKANEHV